MSVEEWRQFTPAVIDYSRCLARTWNNGAGGQCTKAPAEMQVFCLMHVDKWVQHGRVDGPIPEKKLAEFKRKGTKGGAAPGAVPAAAPKKAAVNGTAAPKAAAPKAAAQVGEKRPRESTPPPPPPGGARSGSSGGRAPASKEPPAKKFVPLKCTCGCPIHTEKCKLFKPCTAFTTTTATSYNARLGRPEPPQPPRFSTRPDARPPSKIVAPPVEFVYKWAREKVQMIIEEAKGQKPAERKGLYKRMLLKFHPDKRHTEASRAEVEGRTDEELNEVSRELKRRLDSLVAKEQSNTTTPP